MSFPVSAAPPTLRPSWSSLSLFISPHSLLFPVSTFPLFLSPLCSLFLAFSLSPSLPSYLSVSLSLSSLLCLCFSLPSLLCLSLFLSRSSNIVLGVTFSVYPPLLSFPISQWGDERTLASAYLDPSRPEPQACGPLKASTCPLGRQERSFQARSSWTRPQGTRRRVRPLEPVPSMPPNPSARCPLPSWAARAPPC